MARRGSRYLRRHPAVAGFGIASVIPWVATISLNVVLVAYVLEVMHLGATAYGLADMTYGVGAMTSGIFAALLVLRLGEWRAMTCAMVALIGCYLALAGAPAGVVVFYAVLFLAGFCSSAFRVMTSAYLFKVVPNEVMGRTSSTFLLVSMVLQVVVTLVDRPAREPRGRARRARAAGRDRRRSGSRCSRSSSPPSGAFRLKPLGDEGWVGVDADELRPPGAVVRELVRDAGRGDDDVARARRWRARPPAGR